jgi:hypothetical protein
MSRAQPQLMSAKLKQLHPTQMTVGFGEVERRRRVWRALGRSERKHLLNSHWFPGVRGPDERYFITDHHHLGRALLEEQVREVQVIVQKDLSWLTLESFWLFMEHHLWVHPYDAKGQRQSYDAIPKHLPKLSDDPYRTLSADVRRAGGYAKEVTPFSEFLWADFFRGQIDRQRLDHHYKRALKEALNLAHTQGARHLPGWSGLIRGN